MRMLQYEAENLCDFKLLLLNLHKHFLFYTIFSNMIVGNISKIKKRLTPYTFKNNSF